MTKEQLIELIQKEIPDGDLVEFRTSKDHMFTCCGVDDDSNVGLWHILLREVDEDEHPYDAAIEAAYMWKRGGLTSDISQWKEPNGTV